MIFILALTAPPFTQQCRSVDALPALWRGRLARIALAAGNLDDARAQLSLALATLDDATLPLATWRIYLTAAEIFENFGEMSKASEYRRRFENVMRTLAQNFDPEDRLRASLLTALETKCATGVASATF